MMRCLYFHVSLDRQCMFELEISVTMTAWVIHSNKFWLEWSKWNEVVLSFRC